MDSLALDDNSPDSSAGSCSVAHRLGLAPSELTDVWDGIRLRTAASV